MNVRNITSPSPESKVHNMDPIWGRHVGPKNFVIWVDMQLSHHQSLLRTLMIEIDVFIYNLASGQWTLQQKSRQHHFGVGWHL